VYWFFGEQTGMAMKAVIFDLDDTLVVEQASVDGAFLATCALAWEKYGIDPEQLHQTVRYKAYRN
jgi:putative hydrolase of the HAD superfamily